MVHGMWTAINRGVGGLINKKIMKKFINKHWILILAIAFIPVGNRVFNHVDAWLGIVIMLTSSLFIIYKLFNFIKNEKDKF
jgi:hypothetical protein